MKLISRLAIVSFLGAGFFALGVGVAHATWVGNHCNNNNSIPWVSPSRSSSRNYAFSANGDGYEYGGGCWDQDQVDDTPGAPDSGGEGPDCSGFVFKSWGLAMSGGSFRFWNVLTDIHGPYIATDYHNGIAPPETLIAKSYSATAGLDIFAEAGSPGHVGMIYYESSGGSDQIIEAYNDAQGTGVWSRNYRVDPAFSAAKRNGW